ncbi:Stk1 family PASTA domain-containing Ser/Thr kinase [Clostridium saccharoperbutylacetonicum]|uniref:Stk1 family PASTA domain-containing Ser/Thr kinase n=1 Tax=Clostridium saccharoperbutylacetonicum TaxID=36745 RepID=UPI000983AF68|nr:Stk1 family PASTA domain-containing Ser/Thr kinase [Clostridium saccharoperbutylacetonicum]AQR96147.1 serine/threonine-protein kinase PrkC [Clostridium saccharoperbutylacetonicum]NSB32017.1 serine/threonine-protein kinase [Clostridium saccharoperbutylacetonicum]
MIGTLLLNRYKILEKIGEGGMGIVYKAKCTLLNRFVAIKILKAELSENEDFIARFRREANSAASLSHQNIVSVYDVGSEGKINFIVMEYINGKTLKKLIKENNKLSYSTALDISLQISKALLYAHKNNIIHRDIKPDNILINEENVIKLTDFGIAKVSDSKTLTNSNNIMGSVHYFSPEQAQGKLVDFRTDIYALGIVMYEMFTGKIPFIGDNSISVAIMHIKELVTPPKEIDCEIPDNINSVILKALEKEPSKRFKSTTEFSEIINLIKENPELEVNFENCHDTKTVIMDSSTLTFSDTKINPTVIMKQDEIQQTELITKTLDINKKNKSKNSKIIIVFGFLILAITSYVLGSFLYKETSQDVKNESSVTDTDTPSSSTASTVENIPKEDSYKLVPSLIGKTQDIANSIINNNGFTLGNVTMQYSDTVPKGTIISQSPPPNTSSEKNEKIDLIISQGQKITQISPQSKGNNNGNGNGKDRDEKNKHKNK